MRVIGGIHKGRRLRTVGGLSVRPTSDRLRETLFNILAPRIERARFLDICAGSGAVGIEALSRGALTVTFIERSRQACGVIAANLKTLGITISEATTVNRDAAAAIKRLEQDLQQFDVAFLDPPYASGLYNGVMRQLGSGVLLAEGSIVVVEHLVKTPLQPEFGKLRVVRVVKQGESGLAFYEAVSL